jgi:rhamnogalacturonan endolyase
MSMIPSLRIVVGFLLISQAAALAQRKMESLGRGTIAIPQGGGKVYVGWRLLGTDPDGIAFHLD